MKSGSLAQAYVLNLYIILPLNLHFCHHKASQVNKMPANQKVLGKKEKNHNYTSIQCKHNLSICSKKAFSPHFFFRCMEGEKGTKSMMIADFFHFSILFRFVFPLQELKKSDTLQYISYHTSSFCDNNHLLDMF